MNPVVVKSMLRTAIEFCEQRSFADDAYLALLKDTLALIESLEKDATIPDVDWLANVIRSNDGNHAAGCRAIGAGALAEKIVEAMLASAESEEAESISSASLSDIDAALKEKAT